MSSKDFENKLLTEYNSIHSPVIWDMLSHSITLKGWSHWMILYEAMDENRVDKYKDEVIDIIREEDGSILAEILVQGPQVKRLKPIIIDELVERTFKDEKIYNTLLDEKDYIEAIVTKSYPNHYEYITRWFGTIRTVRILAELVDILPWKWLLNTISSSVIRSNFLLLLIENDKITPKELREENIDIDELAKLALRTIYPHGYKQFDVALGKLIVDYGVSIKMLYDYDRDYNSGYAKDLLLDSIVLNQI